MPWLLVCVACGSEPPPAAVAARCAGEWSPVAYEPSRCAAGDATFCARVPAERCAGDAATLEREVGLRLHRSAAISDEIVAGYINELARYFAGRSLGLWVTAEAQPIELNYVLNGSVDEIFEDLEQQGIDLSDELSAEARSRAESIIDELVWGPMVEFLTRQPRCDCSVDLAVLNGIVAPGLNPLFPDVVLVGFGTSPSGTSHDTSFAESLVSVLQGRALGPVVFLGHEDVEAAELPHGTVAAHELGHALGLGHRDEPDNLMRSALDVECEGQLDGAQVAALQAGLDDCRGAVPWSGAASGDAAAARAPISELMLSRLTALRAAEARR